MKSSAGFALALLVVGLLGCAQTDPESVCAHIAKLQHGSAPNAADRIADYRRLCKSPMTHAKLDRPAEYRCWSKCVTETETWAQTSQCDGCLGATTEFELFQVSKTRKKQEQQKDGAAPPAASAAPSEGGACLADADCK